MFCIAFCHWYLVIRATHNVHWDAKFKFLRFLITPDLISLFLYQYLLHSFFFSSTSSFLPYWVPWGQKTFSSAHLQFTAKVHSSFRSLCAAGPSCFHRGSPISAFWIHSVPDCLTSFRFWPMMGCEQKSCYSGFIFRNRKSSRTWPQENYFELEKHVVELENAVLFKLFSINETGIHEEFSPRCLVFFRVTPYG